MTDTTAPATVDDRAIPTTALVLGAGGVLPFVALALAALLQLDQRVGLAPGIGRAGLVAYGAVILSFLGGVRWGIGLRPALDSGRASALFMISVIFPLIGWAAFFMPRPHDLAVLIAAFLVIGFADVRLAQIGAMPRWYGTLRMILTAAVVLVLLGSLALLPSPEML